MYEKIGRRFAKMNAANYEGKNPRNFKPEKNSKDFSSMINSLADGPLSSIASNVMSQAAPVVLPWLKR